MKKVKFNRRALALLIVTALIFTGYIFMIYRAQKQGAAADIAQGGGKKYNVAVAADRGEILDRSGNTFVYNEQVNTIVLNGLTFPDKMEEGNQVILRLINFLESRGEEWIDMLPIELNAAGVLQFAEDREYDIIWMKSDYFLKLNSYATPQNCYDALIDMFKLEDYTPADARKIASVRYNMTRVGFGAALPYTFAQDVSIQSVAYIKENSSLFPGADAQVASVRKYVGDGTLAPHILGIVGAISAEEYAAQKEKTEAALEEAGDDEEKKLAIESAAYGMNDQIGKSGIEQAMEKYLKGTNGVKTITVGDDGRITEEYTVKPRTGGSAILTLDVQMQEIVEKSLAWFIEEVAAEEITASGLPPAGAVVVEDISTGAILASASYPSYSLNSYYEDYDKLLDDPGKPLWNRAFQNGYAPGSTMKPATCIAALEEGAITPDTYLFCGGLYDFYDQTFVCFNQVAHGNVNVEAALGYSCNIFCFQIAQMVGIEKLNAYASLLGLGQKTGVEIDELEGILAGYDYRAAHGQGWMLGETLMAAIGQSDNTFSLLQMTNYCATIANGGTRYVPYLVSKVLSSDYSEVLYERNPQVAVQTNFKKETLDAVRAGMYMVANETTCAQYLNGLEYKVACKTGTAEKTRIVDGIVHESTDGFLITFGPFEDPKIAITIVVENVLSGSSTSQIAAQIYDYYFSTLNTVQGVQPENQLLD